MVVGVGKIKGLMANKFHEADQLIIHQVEDLIKKYHQSLEDANIAVVLQEEENYRRRYPTVYGKTQLVPAQYTPWMEYDFLIILNEDEWLDLNDAQRTAVLDHQLAFCTESSSGAWALAKPDVVEFTEIIQRHGWWSRELDRADSAHKAYQQQRLPGVDQVTIGAGGRVATCSGAQLERLSQSIGGGI